MTKVWHKGRILLRENAGEVSNSQELWVMWNDLDFTFQSGMCFAREGHDQIYVLKNHSSSSTENRFVDG